MRGKLRLLLGYGAMLVATGAGLWAIRNVGYGLNAPAPPEGQAAFGPVSHSGQLDLLLHVLVALFVITVLARGMGRLFNLIGQPPVIGEIIAGIMLGPSLLGRFSPDAMAFLLPPKVAPLLQILAQMGVIIFMFIVGVELDPGLMRKKGHTTVAISHASIVAPFLLGFLLSLYLYPRLSTSDVPFTAFGLFLGVSMSVTAFPVLARILSDRKMQKTRMGVIALTCAAVDDVTAWCLLALVTSVVTASKGSGLVTAGLAAAYIAFMVIVARPLLVRLARYVDNRGRLSQSVMAVLLMSLLLSSLATDVIGIHALFGAFALGAIIPHDSLMARQLIAKLEDLAVVLFLPAFFAFTGMRTQIGLIAGAENWVLCGLIIVVASLGKFGGSSIVARLTGLPWRESAALGILMNTRGLMELIVLNIGLELKVISPTLFAMLVIMALVTTFATTPILHAILGKDGMRDEDPAAAVLPPKPADSSGVLIPIANPAGMHALIDLGLALSRERDPEPRIVALVRRPTQSSYPALDALSNEQPPQAGILSAALDYARERGAVVEGQAVWTNNPADDILGIAADPDIRWVLLGFHRPVFGSDTMGGVVRGVFERTAEAKVNAAVVIHSHRRKLDEVVVVVDDSDDSRAALELGGRIAHRDGQTLRLVLVPKEGHEPEPALQAIVKAAAKTTGRWLNTQVLDRKDVARLAMVTSGDVVIIGSSTADQIGLPISTGPFPDRLLIVAIAGAPPLVEASAGATLPPHADAAEDEARALA